MKFSPYSHSKLDVWRGCPMKFKLKYVDKIKTPFIQSLALLRGSYFHRVIETNNTEFKTNNIFTEDHKEECNSILGKFLNSEIGLKYISKNGVHEEKFGFGTKLEILDYNSPDVWLRGAIDYYFIEGNILYIIDWKSGNIPDITPDNQTKLYGIYGFLKYPDITEVRAVFVYIEHLKEKVFSYKREDFSRLLKEFVSLTKYVEQDTTYVKRPTYLCDYCDFKSSGHCEGVVQLKTPKVGEW